MWFWNHIMIPINIQFLVIMSWWKNSKLQWYFVSSDHALQSHHEAKTVFEVEPKSVVCLLWQQVDKLRIVNVIHRIWSASYCIFYLRTRVIAVCSFEWSFSDLPHRIVFVHFVHSTSDFAYHFLLVQISKNFRLFH